MAKHYDKERWLADSTSRTGEPLNQATVLHPYTGDGAPGYPRGVSSSKTLVRTSRTLLVAVRLPHEQIARLDALAGRLSLPGMPISRTEAVRACIAAGLPLVERDPRSAIGGPAAMAAHGAPVTGAGSLAQGLLHALREAEKVEVTLPELRRLFVGVDRDALNKALLGLEAAGAVRLRPAPYPGELVARDRKAGIKETRGLLFYVTLK